MSETPLLDKPGQDPDLVELLDYLGQQRDHFLTEARDANRDGCRERYVGYLTRSAERFGRRFDALRKALDRLED